MLGCTPYIATDVVHGTNDVGTVMTGGAGTVTTCEAGCSDEDYDIHLNDSFGDTQDQALSDYMQLSIQLQYNERGRSVGA